MIHRITPHFSWDEVTFSETAIRHGINNTPPEHLHPNILRQAELMEVLRDRLKVPIDISSWYRCPRVNAMVNGSSSSAHMLGLACDFRAPHFGTPIDVARALVTVVDAFGIDQLIYEYGRWVHVGLSLGDPRREVMTAYRGPHKKPRYAIGVIPLSALEGKP